ncbi:hypothetical protein EMCG_02490 [[Emmonsia] crescens]|uniref:DNA mismatch repair protein S5 domain-containing protein n=1 Tax=[Emmonsia] crescens TaxID=73230 RepID=A0A0G2HYC3_9EURO|nr:hypothetical protein EMCG_02490 [Emmonsia crescens UAMH 3008]
MSIVHLPPDTARAVRSAPILFDPCSVVKELIDNSLDAGAACISVEVSANTLDIIQVKDNGAGIHLNDRHLVCKRSCTSKLQTIDDLRNVGGSTLGFRGEALASAAEMCGGILITTRTDGELVGANLKYDRAGLLVSSTKASHLTGTTVRVSEFLRFVPVRKQTALKSASKTISRMKKILNAYVLSRPEIRLSFKILKSKNDSSWVYASKKNATVSNAVLRVVGAEAASQCTTVIWPQIQDDEDSSLSGSIESNGSNIPAIQLVATIPKPGSDLSKINHAGQYVSIDRRPMSTSHGVAKELVKLFKSYLRSGLCCDDNQTLPVDPFFFMHLHCHPGSYDANVEPSKDDVLFEDSKLVMSMAECMFKNVYGEIKPKDTSQSNCHIEDKGISSQTIQPPHSLPASSHRIHEAQIPPIFRHISNHAAKHCYPTDHAFASSSQGEMSNVSIRSSADTITCPRLAENNPRLSKDSHLTSSWMLGKRQYVTSRKEMAQYGDIDSHLLTPVYENERFRFENTMLENGRTNSMLVSPPCPSPLSLQTPEMQVAKTKYDKSLVDVRKSQMSGLSNLPQNTTSHGATKRRELGGSGSLEAWIRNYRDSVNYPAEEGQGDGVSQNSEDYENGLTEIAIAGRFGIESDGVTTGRSQGDYLVVPVIYRISAHINMERDSPLPVVSSEDDDQNYTRESTESHPISTSQEMVAEALDFEYRKKTAVQLHRQKQQQQQQLSAQATLLSWTSANSAKTSQSSPYQNRYTKAKADLASELPKPKFPRYEAAFSLPKMEPADPRAYFMRLKNVLSQTGLKSKRVLTDRLPLEAIPNAFALHGLTVNWTKQDDEASPPGSELSETDEYIRTGIVPPSSAFFEVQQTDISLWATRLLALIQEQYRSENVDGDGGAQLVFDAILTSHATTSA